MSAAAPLLTVEQVAKRYPILRTGVVTRRVGALQAVDGVSFTLARGETLGVVGESGCGKSTLARLLTRLEAPSEGRVLYGGQDVVALSGAELRGFRRAVQMVFQDPYSSLNPTMTVGSLVTEPWRIHGTVPRSERRARAEALLAGVGVSADYLDRRPGELSGGERQRVGIARALALEPAVVVCDEPASALDVSVQAQILTLLGDLQAEKGLAYVFISHDLSVVRSLAHRVAVMYLGRFVEVGPCESVYARPRHPYTRALLDAAHQLHGSADAGAAPPLAGDAPDAASVPSGCRFHPRCPLAQARCAVDDPALVERGDGAVACHYPLHDG